MIFSVLICGVVFTRCSSYAEIITDIPVGEMYAESEWWQPILQKHNLKLGAYNNFDDVFVMGMEENSVNNGICTLKAATALIKNKDNGYIFVEADSIYYNIQEGVFDIMSGSVKTYSTMESDINSPTTMSMRATRIRLYGISESNND